MGGIIPKAYLDLVVVLIGDDGAELASAGR